jgi:hypothetical protein
MIEKVVSWFDKNDNRLLASRLNEVIDHLNETASKDESITNPWTGNELVKPTASKEECDSKCRREGICENCAKDESKWIASKEECDCPHHKNIGDCDRCGSGCNASQKGVEIVMESYPGFRGLVTVKTEGCVTTKKDNHGNYIVTCVIPTSQKELPPHYSYSGKEYPCNGSCKPFQKEYEWPEGWNQERFDKIFPDFYKLAKEIVDKYHASQKESEEKWDCDVCGITATACKHHPAYNYEEIPQFKGTREQLANL